MSRTSSAGAAAGSGTTTGGILPVLPAAGAGAPPIRMVGSLLVFPGADGEESAPSAEGAPPIRMVGSVLMAA